MKRFLAALFLLTFIQCIEIHAQVVWPGDVNNNGIVNGVDLLFWGRAFGTVGASRAEVSEEWQAFPLPAPWGQSFPNGLNYAYADCNGDGIVDEDDFDKAIRDNFGEIHGSISSDGFVNAPSNAAAPKLILETNTPIVLPGSAVSIDLSLAPSNQVSNNFYGIAFSLKYEPALLEGDDGPDFDLDETNWIEADGSYIQEHFVDNKGDGTAMLAITRTNQQSIPIQSDRIGAFSIVIEDIIFGLRVDTFTLEIDSVRLIGDNFQSIPVITNKIDIIVASDTSNIKDSTAVLVSSHEQQSGDLNDVIIFPNPVQDRFFIQASSPIEQFVLYDQIGREIRCEPEVLGTHFYAIRCQDLPTGIYWVQMRRENRIATKKILNLAKHK